MAESVRNLRAGGFGYLKASGTKDSFRVGDRLQISRSLTADSADEPDAGPAHLDIENREWTPIDANGIQSSCRPVSGQVRMVGRMRDLF